jgi:hypothetical protein
VSAPPLDETFTQFWEELLFEAAVSAEPQAQAFFRMYAAVAAQNGDCADLTYAPARREGRGGYQIDGYALDADRGDLYISVSDFRAGRTLETLNSAQIEAAFSRARAFVEQASQPTFLSGLEETSPAFEAAWLIHSEFKNITRIRIIAFSNARLSTRRRPELTGDLLNIPVVCSVLDFARYADILGSHNSAEPIEIDVEELNGSPLPCLPAHRTGGEHASYLLAVPGTLLAQIYGLYGASLLEQNVRTFLQARTKVNAGIIRTLQSAPEMFFAYNNGLTATAAGIETRRLEDGALGIVSIQNLQIVNGGQTTASLLYASDAARKANRADLSKVFVQMKLSVVEPQRLDEIVPKISRYANTQNKISEADFFSGHPLHLLLEQYSRRLTAPPRAGAMAGSRWFYERARGQYRDARAYGTTAEKKRFDAEYPRDQMIDKTSLAKFEVTFGCRPHIVSRGAQKCFVDFAETVGVEWARAPDRFNEQWFRNAVAKAIIFRWTDRMVGKADWYQEHRGYKAQVITYVIAWLVDRLRRAGRELDLDLVWRLQDVPDEMAAVLRVLAPQVARTLAEAPPHVRNVGEYCKQQACWVAVSGTDYGLGQEVEKITIAVEEAERTRVAGAAQRGREDDAGLDDVIAAMLVDIEPFRAFAVGNRLTTPNSESAIARLSKGETGLSKTERNALKYMLEKMRSAGFEIPGGDEAS